MHCTKISLVRHHCGELIQGPLLMSGKQVVVLVTLPMDVYHAKAAFSPRGNGTGVTVWPDGKAKARRAVELLSEAFSLNLRGRVVITKNAEFSEGRGFGSSSAEVLAALRVVNEAAGLDLPPAVLQAIGRVAERANDPLLLGPVLYASRLGRVIEDFGSIPPIVALGFDLGRDVDTSDLAEKQRLEGFSEDHIAGFAVVVSMIRRGVKTGDRMLIAKAATQSARLNQEQIPLPEWPVLRGIAEHTALGVAISHSGTACALLFEPNVRQSTLDDARKLLETELNVTRFYEFTANWQR